MSYEGYDEFLCSKGHYFASDVYSSRPATCPVCSSPWAWRHSVDQTNGVVRGDPGTRPAKLKQVGEEEYAAKRPIFAIPKTGRLL